MNRTVVILEGDQTGQELLEEALRVIDPGVIGLEFNLILCDLSLANRRATNNRVVSEAAAKMREHGLGLKAATIIPSGRDDVGSPNRILREEIEAEVILRTGRRIPGVRPIAGVYSPISVVRMAIEGAYGAKEWREGMRAIRVKSHTGPKRSPGEFAGPSPSMLSSAPDTPRPVSLVVLNLQSAQFMRACLKKSSI